MLTQNTNGNTYHTPNTVMNSDNEFNGTTSVWIK